MAGLSEECDGPISPCKVLSGRKKIYRRKFGLARSLLPKPLSVNALRKKTAAVTLAFVSRTVGCPTNYRRKGHHVDKKRD
jgi:hypothetical protein